MRLNWRLRRCNSQRSGQCCRHYDALWSPNKQPGSPSTNDLRLPSRSSSAIGMRRRFGVTFRHRNVRSRTVLCLCARHPRGLPGPAPRPWAALDLQSALACLHRRCGSRQILQVRAVQNPGCFERNMQLRLCPCAIEHHDDARSVRDAGERVSIVLHQHARKHAAPKRRGGRA